MTLRWASDGDGADATPRAVMDSCPVCGAVREWHYYRFAEHLRNDHGPAEFGLAPLGSITDVSVEEVQ